ncbi:unnamed protein product [Oncorhynchus mykiss]|uniref:Uncharacterized protein n=1 Tax=Oncorhynchus mykiss TaxID=8022 RepID=A0A060YUG0_ONCMY|nr:unnamed protein product [Oncorhynchus mykiss]
MRSPWEPITQDQDMEQETRSARPQGHRSEQPGPLQVLLTPNQEGEEVRPAYQDAALGPGQPLLSYRPSPNLTLLHSSLQPPPTNNTAAQVEEGRDSLFSGGEGRERVRREEDVGMSEVGGQGLRKVEEEERLRRGEERQGVRLEELLQVGGVCVRPLGRHLAISLPSLPLRLWDISDTHTTPSHTHSPSDPQHTRPPHSNTDSPHMYTDPEPTHKQSDPPPTPPSSRSQPHPPRPPRLLIGPIKFPPSTPSQVIGPPGAWTAQMPWLRHMTHLQIAASPLRHTSPTENTTPSLPLHSMNPVTLRRQSYQSWTSCTGPVSRQEVEVAARPGACSVG